MGFPVIAVKSEVTDGGSTKTLTLTQEKFNADGTKSTGSVWAVPVTIFNSQGT
jgi:aminopeptidase N